MVEQIKKLCNDSKTSIKALEKELGFGNGTIRRWDDNTPSIDRISAVANYFNVPVAYLLGTEQKENPTSQKADEVIDIDAFIDSLTTAELIEYMGKVAAKLKERGLE